jgi:ABC-type nickel/cobalt efflux system permease component RcnA
MMSGWRRYLELQAQSKTGLSTGVIVCGLLAAVSAAVTLGLVIFAAFIWLAERYTPLTAALVLALAFLLITIVALLCCIMSQRRTVERAKLALATRSNAPWLDPKFMAVGLQVGRAIGWKKLVPLLAVGVLAAGLGKEWFGRARAADHNDADEDDDDANAEAA